MDDLQKRGSITARYASVFGQLAQRDEKSAYDRLFSLLTVSASQHSARTDEASTARNKLDLSVGT